jgi:hypothetical protein
MLSVADSAPLTEGVKTTLMVQVEFAASEVPQVSVWEKSEGLRPVKVIVIPVTADEVLLASVTA